MDRSRSFWRGQILRLKSKQKLQIYLEIPSIHLQVQYAQQSCNVIYV